MEQIYNKLVRDKIPEIIKNNGETPITRILELNEYKKELETKLFEECKEVTETTNTEERIEELADVLELIRALASIENKTLEDVIKIADNKNIKRGSFNDRIYLEKVETNSQN